MAHVASMGVGKSWIASGVMMQISNIEQRDQHRTTHISCGCGISSFKLDPVILQGLMDDSLLVVEVQLSQLALGIKLKNHLQLHVVSGRVHIFK